MIVLDTHVWLFWINDSLEELSMKAQKVIQSEKTIGISVISCWEIAMLVAKKRIKMSMDVQSWIDQALKYPGIKLLDLTPEIAVLSTRLPGDFHGDPADRFIAAICMDQKSCLISKDQRIKTWGYIKVIW